MSEDNQGGEKMLCCASCGIAGGDDIKLKKCACKLVKYCSVQCQKNHRPKHKEACKKRMAELRDEILFEQPESSDVGDCPICCLPLPIEPEKSTLFSCCSKQICNGCSDANKIREYEGGLKPCCPFCRKALPNTEEEVNIQKMKRIEVNCPVALCQVGSERCHEGDYKTGFEYFARSAALGNVHAHYQLSTMYYSGDGVEKDEKKSVYHLRHAAIGAHIHARHNLGCTELRFGRMDTAAKHFIISAKLGDDKSLMPLKDLYKAGHVSKDDFAAALRGHQASVDATKSPQREKADEFRRDYLQREQWWNMY
eukprot:scaffold5150_cov133-Skeletonema_menzelii.AAC.7